MKLVVAGFTDIGAPLAASRQVATTFWNEGVPMTDRAFATAAR